MELIRLDILITQIIGFLIVLWVLKRYAWKPVLGMLEARRARIANDVATAEKLRQDAEAIRAQYEEQLKTIEVQARQRIQAAVAEGQKLADKIRDEAHRDVRAMAEKSKDDLALEYKKARAQLREEMVAMTLGAAERLLQERMDTAEHRKLVDRFLDELQSQEAE
jgi:F-type H+-transporting ATPase subunit b